ncbi:MAG: tripartite tricarboxylate transporter permease [Acidobacteriota bacterium]
MEETLRAAVEGLQLVLSWPNIVYPVAGTAVAMLFAAAPGVSAVTLLALAIPLTLSWDPLSVVLLFGALVGGSTFTGSISAILMNVPGTAPNAATVLDGHPMARAGRAKAAIACAAAASALGSSFGILVLMLTLPFMRRLVLLLGPPEFLMLALWGLTTIVIVVRGAVIKGVALAGLGVLLACVGFDPRSADLRYTLGTSYLQDGVPLVPVFLGVFAVAEMMSLMLSETTTISGRTRVEELEGSASDGLRAVKENPGLLLRSSLIGTLIGAIPGIGGTVASFTAYAHAARWYRKKDGHFGHGDIRGVLAPEAANDAKDGGSLIPVLAFGVPGSVGTALLLTALLLHGLAPGPELLSNRLPLVFALIWALFLSNWLSSLTGLALINQVTRLTVVRVEYLVPVVLSLAVTSAFIYRGNGIDVFAMFLFGLLGFFMKKHQWPRIALVMGLVLGPVFEINFHLTRRLHELGRVDFWTRPIAMGLLLLIVLSFVPALFHGYRYERGARP